MHQIFELTDGLYQQTRHILGSKKNLSFESSHLSLINNKDQKIPSFIRIYRIPFARGSLQPLILCTEARGREGSGGIAA